MNVISKVLKDEFILSNFNASLPGKTGGSRTHIDSRVPIADFKSTLQIVATFNIWSVEIFHGFVSGGDRLLSILFSYTPPSVGPIKWDSSPYRRFW
jgi:hypothetical protein